jgi:hypothetical protein
MEERQTAVVRKLADGRAELQKFRRFLNNSAVTIKEMSAHTGARTAEEAVGRHVLAIQDTTEINYQSQAGRKHGLGKVGNGTDIGLFAHPVMAIDADDGTCLGLVDVQIWCRKKPKAKNYGDLPIDKKESVRWLRGGQAAERVLVGAAMITKVSDREGDIFECIASPHEEHAHVLCRAARDRNLYGGAKLFATMDGWPEATRYSIELPARLGQRKARTAVLAVRYGEVELKRPRRCADPTMPPSIRVTAIDVREINPPADEEPIHWRLLTTHSVADFGKACQVVSWYVMRWNIEQLFRTVKRQGLDIESSAIESGPALERLAMMALIAACRTMQLVLARKPAAAALPARRVFDEDEISVITALQPRLQGSTEKQQNPHPTGTLAWASWTVARLGGWTGYASERPAGPITMRDGLQRLASIVEGWLLTHDSYK